MLQLNGWNNQLRVAERLVVINASCFSASMFLSYVLLKRN